MTGLYQVWSVAAVPDRPSTGAMIGFLTMAIGFAGVALIAVTEHAGAAAQSPRFS